MVKNYTGDRLNFGLAAEKAKALGLRVEMVIVADDIAIPQAAQPRGLAGTIFVHKIAGYLSESGAPLTRIAAVVTEAATKIFTIGVARDTCTVPGSEKLARIAPDEIEIGLGIHGEPGVHVAKFANSRELIADVESRLAAHLHADRYAVLINNLGGLTGLEMLVVTADLMRMPIASKFKLVAGPAAIMTALDMPGLSISCIELSRDVEAMLLAPADSAIFPSFRRVTTAQTIAPPRLDLEQHYPPSTDPVVRSVVENIIATAFEIEADINALDAKVGDGDTGSTLATAARSVRAHLDELPYADGQALLSRLGDIKRQAMGGSSGVLLAIMLAAASDAYRANRDWAVSLAAGLAAMQDYGGARLGDRTMIDALKPALDALIAKGGLAAAAAKARDGADATSRMHVARAGRSSYLEARSLAGVNDPGAEAIARIFEGLARRFPQI